MAMSWSDLAGLRSRGQRPALPVVVTTWPKPWKPHARELFDSGVMVIEHEAGTPVPVHLLEGLRVILAFENCGHTAAVCRLLRSRGIQPESLNGWCACYRQFTAVPAPCDQTHDQINAIQEHWLAT